MKDTEQCQYGSFATLIAKKQIFPWKFLIAKERKAITSPK